MNRCTTFALCCISKTHRKHTQTRQWKKEQSLHKAENNVLQYLTRLGRPVAHRVAKPRSHSSNLGNKRRTQDSRVRPEDARGQQQIFFRGVVRGLRQVWPENSRTPRGQEKDTGFARTPTETKTGFASMAKQLEDQKRTQA